MTVTPSFALRTCLLRARLLAGIALVGLGLPAMVLTSGTAGVALAQEAGGTLGIDCAAPRRAPDGKLILGDDRPRRALCEADRATALHYARLLESTRTRLALALARLPAPLWGDLVDHLGTDDRLGAWAYDDPDSILEGLRDLDPTLHDIATRWQEGILMADDWRSGRPVNSAWHPHIRARACDREVLVWFDPALRRARWTPGMVQRTVRAWVERQSDRFVALDRSPGIVEGGRLKGPDGRVRELDPCFSTVPDPVPEGALALRLTVSDPLKTGTRRVANCGPGQIGNRRYAWARRNGVFLVPDGAIHSDGTAHVDRGAPLLGQHPDLPLAKRLPEGEVDIVSAVPSAVIRRWLESSGFDSAAHPDLDLSSGAIRIDLFGRAIRFAYGDDVWFGFPTSEELDRYTIATSNGFPWDETLRAEDQHPAWHLVDNDCRAPRTLDAVRSADCAGALNGRPVTGSVVRRFRFREDQSDPVDPFRITWVPVVPRTGPGTGSQDRQDTGVAAPAGAPHPVWSEQTLFCTGPLPETDAPEIPEPVETDFGVPGCAAAWGGRYSAGGRTGYHQRITYPEGWPVEEVEVRRIADDCFTWAPHTRAVFETRAGPACPAGHTGRISETRALIYTWFNRDFAIKQGRDAGATHADWQRVLPDAARFEDAMAHLAAGNVGGPSGVRDKVAVTLAADWHESANTCRLQLAGGDTCRVIPGSEGQTTCDGTTRPPDGRGGPGAGPNGSGSPSNSHGGGVGGSAPGGSAPGGSGAAGGGSGGGPGGGGSGGGGSGGGGGAGGGAGGPGDR